MVLLLDAFHYYAISHYGDPKSLQSATRAIVAEIVVTAHHDLISPFGLHSIFGHRVMRLSKGKNKTLLTAAIVIFSLGVYVSALVVAVRVTKSVVRTLIVYSINFGALTSVAALACLITFIAPQGGMVYLGIFFVLPKLYLNSLLATLNARQSLWSQLTSNSDGPLVLPDMRSRFRIPSLQTTTGTEPSVSGIHVNTQTDIKFDPLPQTKAALPESKSSYFPGA
ncbi:hypothetical protein NLI96_g1739 [Meripilus lineatus]|uniref:DUF6534 domain-containing protein n=1 Tax=Meripilus lineatus TaxID=2056292 RepID=A0AAD5YMM8_9APHY|nr:hypothetical protein NLI96_g1739 [Physisporinus lineatus]